MDDHTVEPENTGGEFESAAAKLRALRERADQALEEQRSRLGSIESELANRVRHLAQEFDQTVAARQVGGRMGGTSEQMQLQAARASLDDARRRCEQLEKERAVIEEQQRKDAVERERLLELLRKAQEQLREQRDAAEMERALEGLRHEHEQAKAQIEILQGEAEELRAQAEAATAVQEQLEQVRSDAEQKQAAAAEQVEALKAKQRELEAQIGGSTDSQQLLDEAQSQLAESQAHIAELESEKRQLQEKSGTSKQLSEELALARESLEEAQATIERLETEAADKQKDVDSQAAALQEQLDAATTQLEEVQNELAAKQTELQDLQSENANVAAQLEDGGDAELQEELEQTQRKFELTLEDVQKLRRENESLREELAARPEAGDEDSSELVAVRAERDALAERVEELEASGPTVVEGDRDEQFAELQRRFEMAVEDVRQLKQENAELRSAASASGGNAEPGAPLDWQAQKARLLAMLEDEESEGPVDEQRQADRATVEGTISITDQVVAERDREIAELRATLDESKAAQAAPTDEEILRAAQSQAIDADQVVQQQRLELEQLKAEWEEKLRTAELEISTERAKIARAEAALRSKLADLERGLVDETHVDESGKPKRRWLAALGLGDETDGDA